MPAVPHLEEIETLIFDNKTAVPFLILSSPEEPNYNNKSIILSTFSFLPIYFLLYIKSIIFLFHYFLYLFFF